MAIKTIFTTSDGLVFTCLKKAEDHEASLINADDVKYIHTFETLFPGYLASTIFEEQLLSSFKIQMIASRYSQPYSDGRIGFTLNINFSMPEGNPFNVVSIRFRKKNDESPLYFELNTNGVTKMESNDDSDMAVIFLLNTIATRISEEGALYHLMTKLWDQIDNHLNKKSKEHS